MPHPHQANNLYHCQRKQRGVALLVMLVIMVLGAATFLVSSLSRPGLQIERDKKISSDALLQTAKEALIAYAVSNDARPGNLPCPDRDAPGDSGYGNAEGSCSAGSGTAIGRLPWKTLGIPELVDAAGEPLWYALSNNFRSTASIINSDTQGTLNVYDADGTTLLTPSGSNAVAIVFSPGALIGGQSRSAISPALCPATGTTIPPNQCASNYLDIGPNSRNNATAAGPFIAANESDTFNDRLLYITADQLLPPIEKRAGNELRNLLKTYYSSWGAYPFAAAFANPSAAPFTGSAANYYGLPPYGGLNGIGIEPALPVWNAIPTISFSGGIIGSMSCILSSGADTNSRWRCCDVSFGSCTGNDITIPAGVTVTITGRLNNVGLGFWKLHDITDTNQVRARDSVGNIVTASSLLNNVSVTSTQNYTNGSAQVVFSGTGIPGGTTLQRIELRDIQYQSSPLPSWFQVNNWHQLMYYATSTNYAFGGNKSCAPACLTVNGSGGINTDKPAVVVMVSGVLSGKSRSSNPLTLCPATGTAIAPNECISNYMELENATPADFIYENKTHSSTFNDQVIIVAP